MTKQKIVRVLVGVVCALVMTVGAASASNPSAIVFNVQNLGDASAACPGSLFGLSFDMVSPQGPLLGNGVSCVRSVEGCQFAAGCHDTVDATFALDFGRGSLSAQVILNETWLTDTKVLQIDQGTVSVGTGDFAGAQGSLRCVGTLQFTATDVIPKLVCLLRLN
jgi:hypothetical protein